MNNKADRVTDANIYLLFIQPESTNQNVSPRCFCWCDSARPTTVPIFAVIFPKRPTVLTSCRYQKKNPKLIKKKMAFPVIGPLTTDFYSALDIKWAVTVGELFSPFCSVHVYSSHCSMKCRWKTTVKNSNHTKKSWRQISPELLIGELLGFEPVKALKKSLDGCFNFPMI